MTPRASRCPGPLSRRTFMRIGLLGLGGLSLPELLAARPGNKGSETSVILFWMWGGPSHLETYDLKPEAPAEFKGEFNPIATNVPGVQICEHFPLQAKMWDKLAAMAMIYPIAMAQKEARIP